MSSLVPTKRAVLASLHFSPVFASHMIAFAKLLQTLGYDVSFLLVRKYAGFADFESVGEVIFEDDSQAGKRYRGAEMAIFVNAAIGNAACAARMRLGGTDVRYIFHEPDSFRNRFGKGWRDLVKFAVANPSSIAMLLMASGVIVPSREALQIYVRHYSKYNRVVDVIPLLFADEVDSEQSVYDLERKRFFSFLGNACEAHNFRVFVETAKRGLRENCGFPFSIATRNDLSGLLNSDHEFAKFVKEGKILVQHGRVLSPSEMDAKYLDSFCVWNLYKCSTQSGVLPRAFIAGTPVIAARIGSFPEYVQPGVNGEFVGSAYEFDAIVDAARKIRENLPAYIEGCRSSFLSTFHYNAGREAIDRILGSLTPGSASPTTDHKTESQEQAA